MAKLNTKTLAALGNVAKASKDSAVLLQTVYLDDSQLLTYPENKEDIFYTADIEASIERLGFIDPIEVTDFGMEDGTYMIVSGNRRRAAGQKRGLKSFPCIVRHFRSKEDIENYALLANNHRDSSKGDPLLLARRALKHKAYLESISFKGSMRDEIATRMGIATAQVDRYLYMHRAVPEFWDMVQEGTVGLSSITDSGLYRHTPDEQMEIYQIVKDCMADGNDMTRPLLKKIVVAYRDGKRSWAEIKEETAPAVTREPDHAPQPPMTLFGPGPAEEPGEADGDGDSQEETPDGSLDEEREEIPDDSLDEEREETPDDSLDEEREETPDDGPDEEREETPDDEPPDLEPSPIDSKEMARTRRIIGRIVDLDDLLTDTYILEQGAEGDLSAGSFIDRLRNLAILLVQEIEDTAVFYELEDKGISAVNEICTDAKRAVEAIQESRNPYR